MRFVRRSSGQARRGVGAATLTALVVVAALAALLPVGAGAAGGAGDKIYWGDEDGLIRAADSGVAGASTLFGGEGGPCGVAVDPAGGKLYWANFFSGEIRAANLDGSGSPSTLVPDGGSPCGISVDHGAGKIYWANYASNLIRVANLDGTGAATLFAEPAGSGPSGVAIDPAAGWIYWTNQEGDQVRRANLDGSGVPSTLFGPADAGDNPLGLAIDTAGAKIYWAASRPGLSGQVRVGNLDGSGSAGILFENEVTPGGVALDPAAGKIYWGTNFGGRVRVANLDGSGTAASVVEGEGRVLFPALLGAPSAGGQLPAISGGANFGDALNCSTGGWKADLVGAFLFRAPRSFAYQWQLDGNDISGATASSFTFTEPGDYTCSVQAANQAGSASQTSAAVTVTLLDVQAFYDANTDGIRDPGESVLTGWKAQVGSTVYTTPKSLRVNAGVSVVTAVSPSQTNWRRTHVSPLQVSAAAGDLTTVRLGNVCVGKVGAPEGTGFWTNKNGQALVETDDLTLLAGLNLRNPDGSDFNPANSSALANWLKLSSSNMAYNLSVQLAVMALNVQNGKVNGNTPLSAAGATSANAAGFATVNALKAEANTEVGAHPLTTAAGTIRTYQTALRDVLQGGNENKMFAQPAPCAFSFR